MNEKEREDKRSEQFSRNKDDEAIVVAMREEEEENNGDAGISITTNNNINDHKVETEASFRRRLLRETEDVLHFYFPTVSAMGTLPFLRCSNNSNTNHQNSAASVGEDGVKSSSELVDEGASLFALALLQLRLAVPVALTAGLRGSMLFVTTIIMGHYVSLQTFASIATALSFINITAMNIGNGLCAALDTLATQAHGRRPYDPEIINIFLRSLVCTFAIYAPMAVLYFFSEPLLRLIVHESLVSETAFFLRYSFIIIIPMLLMNNVLKYAQSQRVNYIGLYASLVGFVSLPVILFLLRHHGAVGVLIALGLNRSIMLSYMVFSVARHPRLRQAWTTEELEVENVVVVAATPALLDTNNNNNNNSNSNSQASPFPSSPAAAGRGNHRSSRSRLSGSDDDDDDDDFFENKTGTGTGTGSSGGGDAASGQKKKQKEKRRREKHKESRHASFLRVMGLHLHQVVFHSPAELLLFIRVSYPVLLASVADSWSFEIFTLIAAHLGAVPAATWNVIMVLYTFLFTIPYGIASAAAVRVGNAVGSGKTLLARRYAIVTIVLSLLNGAVFFVLIGVVPAVLRGLLYLLQREPLVAQTGESLRLLIGFTLGADGIFYALQGVFRGIGQNKAALCIVVIAMWAVALPLAVLFALTDYVFDTDPKDVDGSSKTEVRGLFLALSIGVNAGWPLEILFLWFLTPWKQLKKEEEDEGASLRASPTSAVKERGEQDDGETAAVAHRKR